jgi:hypothetical protein
MKKKENGHVGKGLSTALSGLLLLAFLTQLTPMVTAQLTESFETGWGDWVQDINYDPPYFNIQISSLYAYDGAMCVQIGIHGLPGQFLTGWVERVVPVPPSTTLTVGMTFQLYGEAPADTPRQVLAYIGNANPEDYSDFTLVGMTEQVTGGWFEYSHSNTFMTSPSGQIYVGVGWHNDITGIKYYYIDWIDISGITVDDTPPDITNLQPVNQTTISDGQPTISADYSDASGVSIPSVVLEVDTTNVTASSTVSGADVSYTPLSVLPEGIHNVYLEAADESPNKNKAVKTWWFTVDTLPPVISNEQPADLSTTGNTLPTISASFSDATSGTDMGSVLLRLDSIDVTSSATITPNSVSFDPSVALTDGVHDVYLEVSDNSGPPNKATKAWSFTVDTVPPQITSLVPMDGQMTNNDQPTISASYSDAFGIDISSVMLEVDTFDVTLLSTVTATDVQHTPSFPMTDGVHDVHLYVEDVNSNSAEAFWSFTVDAKPPTTTMNILTPQYTDFISSKTFITSSTPLNLTWDDGTGTGVADVSYLFYAFGEIEPGYSSYASDFTIPNTKADGLIYVKYKSTDVLGNQETEHTTEVYLDNTAPATSPTFGTPMHTASGSTFIRPSTPISLQADDGTGSGTSLTEYRIMKGTSVIVDWTHYTVDIELAGADGERQILLRSTDNLGTLESVVSVDVILDDSAPTTGLMYGDPKHLDTGVTYVNFNTLISLSQDDGTGSGIESTWFKVLNGVDPEIQWGEYTGGSFSLSGDDGPRDVVFRSTDNLGIEETEVTQIVFLDTTAPTSTVPGYDENGTNYISNTLSTITLTATDGEGSGVGQINYGIDDPNCPNMYTGPIVIGTVTEGLHTVYFKAVDNVGNEETIRSISVILDLTAPTADAGQDTKTDEGGSVILDGSGSSDGASGSGISEFTWTIVQDGSTVTLDGANPSHTFEKEGAYLVTLTVKDNAGNEDTDTMKVTVAASAPALEAWWIILLLVLGVVSMLIVFAIFKKKKKKPEEDEERECENCGRVMGPHDRVCPECDNPVATAPRR